MEAEKNRTGDSMYACNQREGQNMSDRFVTSVVRRAGERRTQSGRPGHGPGFRGCQEHRLLYSQGGLTGAENLTHS